MSNPINDTFLYAFTTFDQLIGRRLSGTFKDYSLKVDANIVIDWDPRYSTCNRFAEPFLDTGGDGYWDITVNFGRSTSRSTNVHPSYSTYSKQTSLNGTDVQGKRLSAPTVKKGFMEKRPLENFYPKLKEIMRGNSPGELAFFTASLVFALNHYSFMSTREFLQRWEYVVATQDINYLHQQP